MDVAINLHHQYVITFGQGSCMLIYLNFEFGYGIIASFKKKQQYVYQFTLAPFCRITRQHDIRCMCIASQGSKASFAVESGRVITGSAEGEIFMWRTEKRRSDGSLVILPSCLLTGGRGASRAPVVAVVAALRENADEVCAAIKTCH